MKLLILQVSTSSLLSIRGGSRGNVVYVCDGPNATPYHLMEHCSEGYKAAWKYNKAALINLIV